MAADSRPGAVLPACCRSQRSAPATTLRYFSSAPGTTPRAAQQRVVVLILLRLRMVSPQPPSAFTLAASHARPPEIWLAACAAPDCPNRPAIVSAQMAVAVERALLESSPDQWP